MAEFEIRIPRMSVAISEAELLDLLVEEGAQVSEGDPLFLVATDKVESEIAAGASGTVHWSGEIETVYDIGAVIGVIRTAD
ncbi:MULTISPECIES: lipoyl domain-containing protein [unclassified Pseudofrankia]|uniref:lipoyl domain-containing protein n=1 Tax=unclassified Pseudofrankia TaxID=2994372 RepID=UPI0008D98BF2|nr:MULTISPECIES: biotin/lipoyl-containing protein [unclassified Pseudofrankia]MDT3445789.1 biotin/lipoyl-containing protein [Pseudofrankia sp. BMG5.37]OHV62793.1 dihydrolipoamide acyltransferase [Pseudofrankia sp. BMG5.36]